MSKLISLLIPVHNEAKNLPALYRALFSVLEKINYDFEIIFINDGSRDESLIEVNKLKALDERIKLLDFSRNFGKEIALTAGLNNCHGEAAIMLDADLQHPVELIPEFIAKWEAGAQVVVGVREKNTKEGVIKKFGSKIFYGIINKISEIKITPNSTDFRLVDRTVIDEFNRFTEHGRMTRALIDWLGFERDYVTFHAAARYAGEASYGFCKLLRLALNSFISLSLFPLKLAGYLGVFIIFTVGPFGLYVLIGKYITHWAYASSFSGPAQLAFLLAFLVGVILSALGLISLYIASVHAEVIARPLYVVKRNQN